MTKKKRSEIKTLSLFTGAGGLDIGFHAAGFDIIACVEIEAVYCRSLEANRGKGKHFPEHTDIRCQDIREFDVSPYVGKGIECVIGGPPCQTFSAAGRRSGGVLGTIDARGRLFESYCDILRAIQPKVFVFENVYGLPGANDGGPWAEITSAFSRLGYSLAAEVVDAADYGVSQNRERLIIVGYKGASDAYVFPRPTHGPDSDSGHPLCSVVDAIGDLQDDSETYHSFDGLYGHLLPLVPEGLNYAFFTREMGYPKPFFAWRSKFHDFLYKVDRNAPCRTIKAQPGKFTGPFHWKNRHFTVPELKRLQTFPDDYSLIGTFDKVVEQIGNSVPPLLAQVLAVSVREQLLRPTSTLTYPLRPVGFRSTFRQRQRERTNLYKHVASEEISRRFPNVEPFVRVEDRARTFEVAYEGLYKKRLPEGAGASELGATHFSVAELRKSGHISLEVSRQPRRTRAGRPITIEISGLTKYLLETESLDCTARVVESSDVFKLWDIVEQTLTHDSQFFTLIDIYGHYANRGDTVKVKTSFGTSRNSPLERALEFFGSSENCGGFLDEHAVAELLNVSVDELEGLVAELRSMRWDVRTHRTHPTIRQDGLLCTYPFPLLSGKAQLERRLNSDKRA